MCAPRILAEGNIQRDSSRKLRAFLTDKEYKSAICFNSRGGDLAGAIDLGRAIRELGFNTCLAPSYSRVIPNSGGAEETFVKDVVCASACSVAIVGGVNRLIENDARLGIHQFYSARGNVGDGATQVTVVVLAKYFESMGVSRELLNSASLVSPDKIYWLSATDLRDFQIDNMILSASRWRLDALQDGTVVATIAQIKPGQQSRVALTIVKKADGAQLAIAYAPNKRDPKSLNDALRALQDNELDLFIDGVHIAAYPRTKWMVKDESLVTFVSLPAKAPLALSSGKSLKVSMSVANAFREYDPSLDFKLDGIGRFLSAVLK